MEIMKYWQYSIELPQKGLEIPCKLRAVDKLKQQSHRVLSLLPVIRNYGETLPQSQD